MAILPPDPCYVLRGDMGPVHSVLFKTSPYIEQLYAGTESGNVHIWDLKKNRETLKLERKEQEPCLALRIVGDDQLIVQRKGGAIDVWNADNSGWILGATVDTAYHGFCRCQVFDQDVLLVPLPNSIVGAMSPKTLNFLYKLDPSTMDDPANALGETMAFTVVNSCDNSYVLVAYESGSIALWDIREKSVVGWMKIEECPMAVHFNEDWMRGIVGSPNDRLEIFELKNQVLASKTSISLKNAGISVIASRAESKVFATGGWDGRVRIFSWKTLRPLVVLDQHKGTIHDLAYSTGKVEAYSSKGLMAAAGKDGTISLWDLYNQ